MPAVFASLGLTRGIAAILVALSGDRFQQADSRLTFYDCLKRPCIPGVIG